MENHVEFDAVKVQLINGEELLFQVAVLDEEKDVSIYENFKLDTILPSLTALAEQLNTTLKSAKPSKLKCELGIQLSIDAGKIVGLVVSGSSKANLKITLEW